VAFGFQKLTAFVEFEEKAPFTESRLAVMMKTINSVHVSNYSGACRQSIQGAHDI
jgi:hypothetical protein